MTTKVTQTTNDRTTTHNVDLKGIAGAAFGCVLIGTIIFIVGYATPNWHVASRTHTGVWESCDCSAVTRTSDSQAVQAMTTIGLIFLVLSFIAAIIYMFLHTINKDTVLILLAVFSFCAVISILIGVVVFGQDYGGRSGTLHYSFAFAIIGAILVAIAGVLSIVQMRKSGLFC